MTGKPGLWRLFRWLRRRAAPYCQEPADVGTAFGMELFLDAAKRERVTPEPPAAPNSPPTRPVRRA